jgi:hypothetical protein
MNQSMDVMSLRKTKSDQPEHWHLGKPSCQHKVNQMARNEGQANSQVRSSKWPSLAKRQASRKKLI